MSNALFVVSEEGYWAEECIEPLTTLEAEGVDVTVATPSGSPPVVDERSLDPEAAGGEERVAELRDVDENHPGLNDPEPIATVAADDYGAVVFPGGPGQSDLVFDPVGELPAVWHRVVLVDDAVLPVVREAGDGAPLDEGCPVGL